MWEKQMQALKMSLYVGMGADPITDNAFAIDVTKASSCLHGVLVYMYGSGYRWHF